MKNNKEIESFLRNNFSVAENCTEDNEMKYILRNYENKLIPFERPDAYIVHDAYVYGIEHFIVSQYKREKNSDLMMQAKGSKAHREKMKNDRTFCLSPSIDNLVKSLANNLKKHSTNFNAYMDNVLTCDENKNHNYRLIMLIEDITDDDRIFPITHDGIIVHPLEILEVADVFIRDYCEEIWGIIYAFSKINNPHIIGYTLSELKNKKESGELFCKDKYAPFVSVKDICVSKDDASNDITKLGVDVYGRLEVK